MFGGDTGELAKIAIFDFILGDSEENQIKAFNRILSKLKISTQLEKTNGKYVWINCSYSEKYKAEKLFECLTNLMSHDQVENMIEKERFAKLISEYKCVIDTTMDKFS